MVALCSAVTFLLVRAHWVSWLLRLPWLKLVRVEQIEGVDGLLPVPLCVSSAGGGRFSSRGKYFFTCVEFLLYWTPCGDSMTTLLPCLLITSYGSGANGVANLFSCLCFMRTLSWYKLRFYCLPLLICIEFSPPFHFSIFIPNFIHYAGLRQAW